MKVTITQSKTKGVEEIEMKIERSVEDENSFIAEIVEDEKFVKRKKLINIDYYIGSSLKILKYILLFI